MKVRNGVELCRIVQKDLWILFDLYLEYRSFCIVLELRAKRNGAACAGEMELKNEALN